MTGSIIADTREQDLHIVMELERRGIKCERRKLNYGDYSFEAGGRSYECECVIERKGSIDELIGNMTKDKARFEREFIRARGAEVVLLVEASPEQIDARQYRSAMKPADVKRRLATWCHTFQLRLVWSAKDKSCDTILQIFRDHLKARQHEQNDLDGKARG